MKYYTLEELQEVYGIVQKLFFERGYLLYKDKEDRFVLLRSDGELYLHDITKMQELFETNYVELCWVEYGNVKYLGMVIEDYTYKNDDVMIYGRHKLQSFEE